MHRLRSERTGCPPAQGASKLKRTSLVNLGCSLVRMGSLFVERLMGKKLYVGNLAYQVADRDLAELFAQVGAVASASVITDRETGRSRGFGFVEMGSDGDAERAIEEMDGRDLMGRALKVNEARQREGGGGGGRGGFGGGGRGGYGGGGGRGGFGGGGRGGYGGRSERY